MRLKVNSTITVITDNHKPIRISMQQGAMHADILGTAVLESPVFDFRSHWKDSLFIAKGGAV
jgi:hypothetical protein